MTRPLPPTCPCCLLCHGDIRCPSSPSQNKLLDQLNSEHLKAMSPKHRKRMAKPLSFKVSSLKRPESAPAGVLSQGKPAGGLSRATHTDAFSATLASTSSSAAPASHTRRKSKPVIESEALKTNTADQVDESAAWLEVYAAKDVERHHAAPDSEKAATGTGRRRALRAPVQVRGVLTANSRITSERWELPARCTGSSAQRARSAMGVSAHPTLAYCEAMQLASDEAMSLKFLSRKKMTPYC